MRQTLAALPLLFLAGTTAAANAPIVVTDIPPVHALVATVMDTVGSPVLLLDQGADAHDFQLRPSQASALADADLIFWIGPELTPWLERARAVADEAASVPLLHLPATYRRAYGDDGHDHDAHEASGADHAADAEPAGHDHADGDIDPHAWLDPANAALWLGRIADELSARDPGNAVTYRANASLAQTRLLALETDLQEKLTPARSAPIVVAHDSLGYFADHFGLTVAGAVAEGDAADPGAAHLSAMRALLQSGDVVCIFPEAQTNPQRITALAEGTPARIGAALDPEARALTPGPALYPVLLTELADAIADCIAGR